MNLLTRAAWLSRRSIDEATRTATFIAATEGGIDTWMGKEYLRMSGCKLDRYNANPVFLDSHRYETSSVIGKTAIAVDGRQLIARVTYATTPRAEDVWQLVKTGFLRAVSVGFNPLTFRELLDGETDGEGDARVMGPGVVINEWELFELSQVPIPADKDALIRRAFVEERMKIKRSIYDPAAGKPAAGAAAPAAGTPGPAPASPAPSAPPVTRAADTSDDEDESDSEFALESALKGLLGLSAGATDEEIFEAVKALQSDEDEEDDEAGTRSLKGQVLELAPPSLREFAEGLVLEEGMTVAVARKRLQEEYAKRSAPVGTPEPLDPTKTKPSTGAPASARVADLSDEDMSRAFKR